MADKGDASGGKGGASGKDSSGVGGDNKGGGGGGDGMMKAPGSGGEHISREKFENNPKGYFDDLHHGGTAGGGGGVGVGDRGGGRESKEIIYPSEKQIQEMLGLNLSPHDLRIFYEHLTSTAATLAKLKAPVESRGEDPQKVDLFEAPRQLPMHVAGSGLVELEDRPYHAIFEHPSLEEDSEDEACPTELQDADEPLDLSLFKESLIFNVDGDVKWQGLIKHKACLTYRELWRELGLEARSDRGMRIVLGLPAGADLDAQHLDFDIGPIILAEEAGTGAAEREWSEVLPLIRMRMGFAVVTEARDD